MSQHKTVTNSTLPESGTPDPEPLWQRHPTLLAAWCIVSAFGTYACMYGFRKPFTAALYIDDPSTPGLKASLIASQVLGYTVSKMVGIRVIAAMPNRLGPIGRCPVEFSGSLPLPEWLASRDGLWTGAGIP